MRDVVITFKAIDQVTPVVKRIAQSVSGLKAISTGAATSFKKMEDSTSKATAAVGKYSKSLGALKRNIPKGKDLTPYEKSMKKLGELKSEASLRRMGVTVQKNGRIEDLFGNKIKDVNGLMKVQNAAFARTRFSADRLATSMLGLGLGVMFTGMVIKKFFDKIIKQSLSFYTKVSEGATEGSVAITALSANFEFLKYAVGDAIGSSLAPFVPTIQKIINGLVEFIDTNPEFVTAVVLGGLAIGTVMTIVGQFGLFLLALKSYLAGTAVAFGGAGGTSLAGGAEAASGAVGGLGGAISGLATPIALIIAAIVALKVSWDKNIGGIRESAGRMWDELSAAFGDIGSGLDALFKGKFPEALTFAAMAVGRFILFILETARGAIAWGIAAANGLVGVLIEIIGGFFGWMVFSLAKVLVGMGKDFEKFQLKVNLLFNDIARGIVSSFAEAGYGVIKGLYETYNKIRTLFGGIGKILPEAKMNVSKEAYVSAVTNLITPKYNIKAEEDKLNNKYNAIYGNLGAMEKGYTETIKGLSGWFYKNGDAQAKYFISVTKLGFASEWLAKQENKLRDSMSETTKAIDDSKTAIATNQNPLYAGYSGMVNQVTSPVATSSPYPSYLTPSKTSTNTVNPTIVIDNLNAGGMSPEEFKQLIRDTMDEHWDTQLHDIAGLVESG